MGSISRTNIAVLLLGVLLVGCGKTPSMRDIRSYGEEKFIAEVLAVADGKPASETLLKAFQPLRVEPHLGGAWLIYKDSERYQAGIHVDKGSIHSWGGSGMEITPWSGKIGWIEEKRRQGVESGARNAGRDIDFDSPQPPLYTNGTLNPQIEKELEAILGGQDVGDGDVDVDGVLQAFNRLSAMATKSDLPTLVAAIQSPRNNFWTRELLSEPICRLGGTDCLEVLLAAAQLGEDEGHDNDGFNTFLIELAEANPAKCRSKLQELLARDDFKQRDLAKWLLEFCERDKSR